MTSEIIQNRYELKQRLGSGAMGSVYRAFDRLTGDEVALKQVIQTWDVTTVDPTTANLALAHEFQMLASLRHPNIIGVLDYGFYDKKTPYFTMSFVRDSNNMRTAAIGLSLTEKVQLIVQLLTALVYLERRGIIHRDLKPDNILVTPQSSVKVVDFGLARDYQADDPGEIGGTLAYIAPEIFRGHPPTHVSDLYAIGVIAYEIFAETPLYSGDLNVSDILQKVVALTPDFKPFLTRVNALLNEEKGANTPPKPEDGATQMIEGNPQAATLQFEHEAVQPVNPEETFQNPATDALTEIAAYQKITQPSLPKPPELDNVITAPTLLEGDETGFRLARVVQKLLSKNPQQRYQHAELVIYDFCRAINVPSPFQTTVVRESFLQAARFIGRENEFDQLKQGLTLALERQGGLYFIGGESGVGKSRLLSELRHLALVKGMLVLNGQAVREGSLPYQAWREVIRRLTLYGLLSEIDARSLKPIIPDLDRLLGWVVPDAIDDENAFQRITTAMLNLFRTCPDPLLLLLEDWQWAQTESRDFLKRLHDYAQGSRLFIVVSYRNDEVPALPDQYPGSTTILLERLNAAHVEELATSILGRHPFRSEFIQTLHRHTEGNVFFLIETIRALAEEAGSLEEVVNITLPESLVTGGMTQVIQRRLDKLPTIYRPLLETAAIAGRELNLKLLRDLNRGSRIDFEDWLTSAVNSAIVEYRDELWRFSHDKLRQHLLMHIDAPRQQILHRQIAETIERLYPTEEQAAALVIHWRAAGNIEKELHYSRIAGEQATRYNDYEEASHLYERALTLTTDPLLVMEFNNLLGGACEYLSQYERAMECLNLVLTLAREHHQQTTLAEALHKMAWIYMRQGNMAEAHRHADEALTISRETQNTLLMVRALSVLGVIYVIQGDSAHSRDYLEQALPLVKTLDNVYLHATVLNTLGAAYEGEGRVDDAIDVLTKSAHMAEEIRNRDLLANVHGNLGRILYIQKRTSQAEESFLKALPSFNDVGNLYGSALANDYLGLIAANRHDATSAKPYLREGIRISRMIGAQTVTLLALCGVAHLQMQSSQREHAVEIIGMILAHSASAGDIDVQRECDALLAQMPLTGTDLQEALARGGTLNFDEAVTLEYEAL